MAAVLISSAPLAPTCSKAKAIAASPPAPLPAAARARASARSALPPVPLLPPAPVLSPAAEAKAEQPWPPPTAGRTRALPLSRRLGPLRARRSGALTGSSTTTRSRGVLLVLGTASASDLARLGCELWQTQNGIWNPDVLVYDALSMICVRAGLWPTFPPRPLRVI